MITSYQKRLALRKLVFLLARKHKVDVVFGEPKTNGTTVSIIDPLDPVTEEMFNVSAFTAMHEISHVAHTDFELGKKRCAKHPNHIQRQYFAICNALEDIRIECLLHGELPNAIQYTHQAYHFLVKPTKPTAAKDLFFGFLHAVITYAKNKEFKAAGWELLPETAQVDILDAIQKTGVFKMVDRIMANPTKKKLVYDYADKLLDFFAPPPPPSIFAVGDYVRYDGDVYIVRALNNGEAELEESTEQEAITALGG